MASSKGPAGSPTGRVSNRNAPGLVQWARWRRSEVEFSVCSPDGGLECSIALQQASRVGKAAICILANSSESHVFDICRPYGHYVFLMSHPPAFYTHIYRARLPHHIGKPSSRETPARPCPPEKRKGSSSPKYHGSSSLVLARRTLG